MATALKTAMGRPPATPHAPAGTFPAGKAYSDDAGYSIVHVQPSFESLIAAATSRLTGSLWNAAAT